jgi:glutamate dehydrogenase/leucine dehydrogenase
MAFRRQKIKLANLVKTASFALAGLHGLQRNIRHADDSNSHFHIVGYRFLHSAALGVGIGGSRELA